MLHALLITDNREAAELLGSLIRSSGQIVLDRVFSPPPSCYQLITALNTLALDVAFIDVSNYDHAAATYEQICDKCPQVAVVGFSSGEAGRKCQTAVTPFTLDLPFSTPALLAAVREAMHAVSVRPYKNVYVTMPAKAGSGASTVAVNLAAQISQSCDQRVLVADCDLRSGTIAEYLDLRPQQSICKTLSCADVAETLIWSQHVCRKSGIDFLLTTREQAWPRPEWHSYYHLLSFVTRRYDSVLFDLPELVNDATAELVQSATGVYVVTTPEILSLKLARQRINELNAANVDRSRIRVIVNRWQTQDLSTRQISEVLDCPVEFALPNDYQQIKNSIAARSFVDPKSKLGRAYLACAKATVGSEALQGKERKGSLWELFRPATDALSSPW